MKKALIVAILMLARAASAEEAKPAKAVSCRSFSVAKETDGSEVGICGDGKKPALLRTFAIVNVNDPATGKPVRLMVGFR